MVRGNWQKRVEKAQTRRTQTKQKKFRKDSKGIYKNLVQNHLWPLLDEYSDDILQHKDDGIGKTNILHLWVDSRPLSLNLEEGNDGRPKNRYKCRNADRKDSFDSALVNTSMDRQKSKCEKTKHPRSHAPSSTGSVNNAGADEHMLLCKQHFFDGRCNFTLEGKGSKKGTCPYNHFSKKNGQETLVDVLCPNAQDRKKKSGNEESTAADIAVAQGVLNASSIAATAEFSKGDDSDEKFDEEHSPVHMMYHLTIPLLSSSKMKDSANTLPSSSDLSSNNEVKERVTDYMQKVLTSEKCPTGSIVYIVFNKILIFDRYLGGVLVDKKRQSEIFAVNSTSEIDRNKVSSGEENIGSSGMDSLPSSVLECILKFLPDEATGVIPMVCKAFSQEIGMSSPSLWRHLISRRRWPVPDDTHPMQSLRDIFRDSFLSHYEAIRNVCSIMQGVQRLNDGKDCDKAAIILYPRVAECIRPWSDISIITANKFDCTLTLLEAVRNGTKLAGKEIMSVRVAPFPNSKKIVCCLISMDVDDDYIACCFESSKQGELIDNIWLVAITRNDFLCHVSGVNQDSLDGLQKYDLQECYVTHLRENCSENENIPLDLNEYITLGGDLASIYLSLFGNMEACGNGLFMLIGEVLICHESHPDDLEPVGTVLVLFSVPRKSIVWSQFITEDPEAPLSADHDHEHNTIQSYVRKRSQSNESSTFLCLRSTPMHLIRVGRRNEQVTCGTIDKRLISSRNQALFPDCWESLDLSKRLSLVTNTHVVFADILLVRYNLSFRVVLSFLPLEVEASESDLFYKDSMSNLSIEKCQDVKSLHYDGKDHVIMQCMYKNEDEGDISSVANCDYLVVVHIPSKAIIHYCRVIAWVREDVKLTFDGAKSTIMALSIDSEGLVMTSDAIRNLTKVAEECPKTVSKSSKKKKKKRLVSKLASNGGGKKDGFARGMSLRG